jgi:hypothetical protein
MNQDDIIRMAREAGLWKMLTSFSNEFGNANPEEDCMKELERFAALVAAAEREACAQLAEGWQYLPENNFSKEQIVENMCKTIAHHIRARGQA